MDIYNFQFISDKKQKEECYDFVRKNHYTKSIGSGCKLCFGLYENENLIGVGLWRTPNGRLTYKLFEKLNVENNKKILDLTRLCCIDETRKNTESFFLGKMIKYIKNNNKDIDFLITYADFNQGHSGIIYKASNWINFGTGGDTRKVYNILENGKLELSSSRWMKDKKNILTLKINKKFRFFYPLRIKRKKILKIFNEELQKYEVEHKKLQEQYEKTNNFNLKETDEKYYCKNCKNIFNKICNCNE